MKNFPSKITTIHNSIVWTMMVLLKNIPHGGISINNLKQKSKFELDDFLQALTYLYALNYIEYTEDFNRITRC